MQCCISPVRPTAIACIALAGLIALGTSRGQAADDAAPRDTPLSSDDELATFQLADKRLVVELVAQEPQVDSPVAISWDADGRMYVAEMIDYPTGPTAGRIRLLDDRDNDGRYEQATVFAEGLNFPNGVLAARSGVFVTAAPDLLFFKDTDGDGRADGRTVVFTGFGEGNQQLRANGLTWGLDNWIYGANGRSDGDVRRPNESPEKAVSIRARDFRFRPDGSRFEAIAGQSQFGQTRDDWGNRFVSWNTIPIRQAVFDQAFIDRNPRLSSFGVRDLADPADTGRVFPISPTPRTFNRERVDYYNALCGLTIYRGDGMGSDYLGNTFVGESLTNLVHRRTLAPRGSTLVSRRGDYDREFLASSDSWFHPVFMTTGPDGALYIADFYRQWVEHPAFVPESSRGKVDWRKGSGHGRIWKVSRRENTWPPKPRPQMSKQSTLELVQHLASPNAWWRDTAQRLLVERNDPKAVALLATVIAQSHVPQAKVQAMSVLDAMEQLDDGILLRALEDGNAHVRQMALRLATPRLDNSLHLRTAAMALAAFPDSLDRFQAALSMGAIKSPEKITALVKLADLEARDPLIPVAIAGGLGRSVGEFLQQILDTRLGWRSKPNAAQLHCLSLVAATACGTADDVCMKACLETIAPPQPPVFGPGDLAVLAGIVQGLDDRGKPLRAMMDAKSPEVQRYLPSLAALISAARTMATMETRSVDHRLVAIEVLSSLDPTAGKLLAPLLDPRYPQALQTAATGAVVRGDADTAAAMLAAWSRMTTSTRRALVDAALRSPVATAALVRAVEQEQILPRELDLAARQGLLAVRDAALRQRVEKLFPTDETASRREVLARFEPVLERQGDRARGAAVFQRQCLICHSLQGRGQRVGPDLSGIGARPKDMVLVDVLDPSRQVSPNYVSYTLLTRDGQVLTGLIAAETASSVTLRRAEGAEDIVLRSHIDELRSTGRSLMPEGLEQNLTEDNMVDLLTFLAQPDAELFRGAP